MSAVAVLFCREDSIYKTMPGVDAWDMERDARKWPGGVPAVAHPPCRAWGRLRGLANPRDDEKDLGIWAVGQVRKYGGVLEHPAFSKLWEACDMPKPGQMDEFGGWTLDIYQSDWGHKAQKRTWLYIVGASPIMLPEIPIALGEATHIVASSGRRKDGSRLRSGEIGRRGGRRRPELSKADRERTPPRFAQWLVQLAARCYIGQGEYA